MRYSEIWSDINWPRKFTEWRSIRVTCLQRRQNRSWNATFRIMLIAIGKEAKPDHPTVKLAVDDVAFFNEMPKE